MIELFQLAMRFIETQGMLSFVVLVFAFFMYRQQSQIKAQTSDQNANIKGMIANQAAESQQQGKMLDAFMVQSVGIANISGTITTLETSLLQKATEISQASSTDRQLVATAMDENTAKLQETTGSVNDMNQQFKTLEKAIRDVLDKVEGGMSLDESTKNEIIAEVSKNISNTVHDCMEKAIKTATQEAPVIPPGKPKTAPATRIESKEVTK